MAPTYQKVNQLLWPAFESLESRVKDESGLLGTSSGITDLDRLTAGWQAGDLIVLSGATSMGKSALAIRLATHPAISNSEYKSGIVTLELTPNRLIHRILCAEGRVDLNRFARGATTDDEYARLAIAAGCANSINTHVLHSSRLSINDLFTSTVQLKQQQGLDLLVVDTLNLLCTDGCIPAPTNREQEIGVIARGLKSLALELGIPVVATANLSRSVEHHPDKWPQLSDLRDSGEIENSADVVMFIYRPEWYWGPVSKQGDSLEGRAELIIAKNRNGPTGVLPLLFRKEFAAFEENT